MADYVSKNAPQRSGEAEEYSLSELLKADFWRRVRMTYVADQRLGIFNGDAPAKEFDEAAPPPRPSLAKGAKLMLQRTCLAVVTYRLAHAAYQRGIPVVPRILSDLNLWFFGLEIDHQALIGPGLFIGHPVGNIIGWARIGRNFSIMGGVTIGTRASSDPLIDGFPTIGDDVWFMHGSGAWGPIDIGDRTWIGARATLNQSVPADTRVIAPKPQVIINPPRKWL